MYKLTEFTSVIRSDGVSFPADPANTDYAAYLAWVNAGNTPEPADLPDPQIAIAEKLLVVRAVREGILDRLGGIAGRASRKGDTVTAGACDAAAESLLDITKGLPGDLDAIVLEIVARYGAIVTTAATAAPGLLSAFAGVDL